MLHAHSTIQKNSYLLRNSYTKNGTEKDGCESMVGIVHKFLYTYKTYLKDIGFGTIVKFMQEREKLWQTSRY